jgi:hypothetical protein
VVVWVLEGQPFGGRYRQQGAIGADNGGSAQPGGDSPIAATERAGELHGIVGTQRVRKAELSSALEQAAIRGHECIAAGSIVSAERRDELITPRFRFSRRCHSRHATEGGHDLY